MPEVFGARPVAMRSFSATTSLAFSVVGQERHFDSGRSRLRRFQSCPRMAVDSLTRENAAKFFGNFLVFQRNELRQGLQQRDLCAKVVVDRGKLHADGARANNDQRLRNSSHVERADVGDDLLFIHRVARQRFRFRTGRDNDVPRFDFCYRVSLNPDSVWRKATSPNRELTVTLFFLKR